MNWKIISAMAIITVALSTGSIDLKKEVGTYATGIGDLGFTYSVNDVYEGDTTTFSERGLWKLTKTNYEVRSTSTWTASNYRPSVSLDLYKVTVKLWFFKTEEFIGTITVGNSAGDENIQIGISEIQFNGANGISYIELSVTSMEKYKTSGSLISTSSISFSKKDKCQEAEGILNEIEYGATGRKYQRALMVNQNHNNPMVDAIHNNTVLRYERAKSLSTNAKCNDAYDQSVLAKESAHELIKNVLFNANANEQAIINNDNVPPTIESTDILYTLELRDNQVVTIITDDLGTGVSGCTIEIQGVLFDMQPLGDNHYTFTWEPDWIGNYTVTAECVDLVGNEMELPLTFAVVDTIPPEFVSTTIEHQTLVLGQTQTITATAEDFGTGVSSISIVIDGTVHQMTQVENRWTYSWIPMTTGLLTITLIATDLSGNEITEEVAFTVVDFVYVFGVFFDLGETKTVLVRSQVADLIQSVELIAEGQTHTMTQIDSRTWTFDFTPTITGSNNFIVKSTITGGIVIEKTLPYYTIPPNCEESWVDYTIESSTHRSTNTPTCFVGRTTGDNTVSYSYCPYWTTPPETDYLWHMQHTANGWMATDRANGMELVLDLGEVRPITQIYHAVGKVGGYSYDSYLRDYEYHVSEDGQTWTMVAKVVDSELVEGSNVIHHHAFTRFFHRYKIWTYMRSYGDKVTIYDPNIKGRYVKIIQTKSAYVGNYGRLKGSEYWNWKNDIIIAGVYARPPECAS